MCRLCTSDAILGHESENVQDRVLSLEKKVQQQDDEIVCLKSALADALRRLASLESGLSGCLLVHLSAVNIRSLLLSSFQYAVCRDVKFHLFSSRKL